MKTGNCEKRECKRSRHSHSQDRRHIAGKTLVKIKSKESGVYPVVLSDPLAIRKEGIENQHNNEAAKKHKRKDRRKDQNKKRLRNAI